MKILCWNVCRENTRDTEHILDFLQSHEADVVCLQEVRQELYDTLRLRLIQYHCFATENIKHDASQTLCYVVTLSRFPISHAEAIRQNRPDKRSIASWWKGVYEDLGCHYIDITTPHFEKTIRIFNLHLEYGAGPLKRSRRFKSILKTGFDYGKHNIVAGDFNTFGTWYYHLIFLVFCFWWVFGYTLQEIFSDERNEFEKEFSRFRLRNVFKNRTTFPLTKTQLDHILVPQELTVVKEDIFRDKFGSDHYSITVTISR